MSGNGYFDASVKDMTLPLAPATSIPCNRGITLQSVYIYPVIRLFL